MGQRKEFGAGSREPARLQRSLINGGVAGGGGLIGERLGVRARRVLPAGADEVQDLRRRRRREVLGLPGSVVEDVAAVLEHVLRVVMGVDGGLNPEVPEHGVGSPAAQELDAIGVGFGAEEGCGPSRAQGFDSEEGGRDTGAGADAVGPDAQPAGDLTVQDVAPAVLSYMEVAEERRVRGCSMLAVVQADPCHGLDRAEHGIGVGFVPDLFAANRILLVSERKSDILHTEEVVHVIERCVGDEVGFAFDGKADVLKLEGLGPQVLRVCCAWAQELTGAEEPVETDDGEAEDVTVDGALGLMVEVKVVAHGLEEEEAARVDSGGRVVELLEAVDELGVEG